MCYLKTESKWQKLACSRLSECTYGFSKFSTSLRREKSGGSRIFVTGCFLFPRGNAFLVKYLEILEWAEIVGNFFFGPSLIIFSFTHRYGCSEQFWKVFPGQIEESCLPLDFLHGIVTITFNKCVQLPYDSKVSNYVNSPDWYEILSKQFGTNH